MESQEKSTGGVFKFGKPLAGVGLLLVALGLWGRWSSDVMAQKAFYSDENNWKASFEIEQTKLEQAKYMIAPTITWYRTGRRQSIGMRDLKVEVVVESPQIPGWRGTGHQLWGIPLEVKKAGKYKFNVNVTAPDRMLGGDIAVIKVPFDYRPFAPLGVVVILAGMTFVALERRRRRRRAE